MKTIRPFVTDANNAAPIDFSLGEINLFIISIEFITNFNPPSNFLLIKFR